MRRRLLGLSVALALTASAGAADPPKTPAARLAAIKKEVADAQAAFYKVAVNVDEKKKEEVERANKLYEAFSKKQEAGFAEALTIAQADPKSDTAFAALEWLLTTPRAYYGTAGRPAMELMAKYHAANPKIIPVVRMLGRLTPHEDSPSHAAAVALLQTVAEKNPNRTARGYAALGLASQAIGKHAAAEYKHDPDAEKLATAAEKQLETVIKEFGTLAGIGERAKADLFELRNLRVGKVAPDIAGEDLDGVKFKLSDYRGKVVALDFWGDW
jgi:hypothetical protein